MAINIYNEWNYFWYHFFFFVVVVEEEIEELVKKNTYIGIKIEKPFEFNVYKSSL